MLQLTVVLEEEMYDSERDLFIDPKLTTLSLEHSLISLSKWEAKWHKPFFSDKEKTQEEALDYVRCMSVSSNVKPEVYEKLSLDNLKEIEDYITNPMTATTFSGQEPGGSRQKIITSELIYCWMTMLNIPVEFEKWHVNRLLTLIRVCEIQTQPQKKMGRSEIMRQNAAINAARRKKFNSRG